ERKRGLGHQLCRAIGPRDVIVAHNAPAPIWAVIAARRMNTRVVWYCEEPTARFFWPDSMPHLAAAAAAPDRPPWARRLAGGGGGGGRWGRAAGTPRPPAGGRGRPYRTSISRGEIARPPRRPPRARPAYPPSPASSACPSRRLPRRGAASRTSRG